MIRLNRTRALNHAATLFFATLILVAAIFSNVNPTNAQEPVGPENRSTGEKNGKKWSYQQMDSYRSEVIARFFVEHADLLKLEQHSDANAAQLPPLFFRDGQAWRLAESGHWISPGDHVIASMRTRLVVRDSFRTQTYKVRQLTIMLPGNAGQEGGRYTVDGGNWPKPLVFWSKWGHSAPSCFAYATHGVLDVEFMPLPPSVVPERRDFFSGNPFMRTMIVKAHLKFDGPFDETKILFGYTGDPECEPFEISDTLEFYWRPVSSILNDFQKNSGNSTSINEK